MTWKEIEPMVDAVVLLLVFAVYCLIEGWREALYFHVKESSGVYFIKDWKEHKFFTCQRFCFMALVPIYVITGMNSLQATITYLLALVSQALMFSFLHDGMYYTQRNNLNPEVYPHRWFDQTTTSDAKMNFNFNTRSLMFIIGFIVYTAFNIFHLHL